MSSFTQLGSNLNGAANNGQLGHLVSLSSDGTTLAIGIPLTGRPGKTQIYSWNGTALLMVSLAMTQSSVVQD